MGLSRGEFVGAALDGTLHDKRIRGVFARSSRGPAQLDARKLEALAADWFAYASTVTLEMSDAEIEGTLAREPPPPPKKAVDPTGGGVPPPP